MHIAASNSSQISNDVVIYGPVLHAFTSRSVSGYQSLLVTSYFILAIECLGLFYFLVGTFVIPLCGDISQSTCVLLNFYYLFCLCFKLRTVVCLSSVSIR